MHHLWETLIMTARPTALATLACLLITMSATCHADNWPQWRGANRDGHSPEKGLLDQWPEGGPTMAWAIDTPGLGYAAPSIVGTTVYVTGNEGEKKKPTGVLYALEAADGSLKWKQEYGPEWGRNYAMARSTPTVLNNRIYLYSGVGTAVCMDATSGDILWSVDTLGRFGGKNIKWGIAESPLVVGNAMICQPGGKDAAVVALDTDSGETLWTSKGLSDLSSYCSPLAVTCGALTLVVTQTDQNIAGINASDGNVLWKEEQKNRWAVHPNTPAYADGRLFISSGYGYGSRLLELASNGRSVTEVWRTKSLDNHFQGVIAANQRLYGTASKGGLVCLNPQDGVIAFTANEVKKAAIAYADGCIYAYEEKGGGVKLVSVSPSDYSIKGSFKVSRGSGPHWAHPVIADGRLYIRHGEALLAYTIK